jgi:chromosome partitioning protein
MIVLFGGEKGGSGKTTLATNVAILRTIKQPNTILIDTDKQSTASFWCSTREIKKNLPLINNVQKFEETIKNEIEELNNQYHDIIIDAGGRDSLELRSSMLVCDKAIFPLRPSQFDLWTLGRLDFLVEMAKAINNKLQAYILINMASCHPNVTLVEVTGMTKLIKEFPQLNTLKSIIYERIVYRKVTLQGQGVIEFKPQDVKASQEVESLYEEIYGEDNE